jgi:protein-S-isoprenylcysteine O-methyltransferase Ste14
MEHPIRVAVIEGVLGLIVFAALIFGGAGTWNYWQGWVFLALFAALTAGSTAYLARYDRPLMERRLAAGPWQEAERSQQIIVSLIILAFFACVILPALDHRFGISPVAGSVSILGDGITLLSFFGMFWALATNSWAAANVSVTSDQRVVDTGPYARVRHPMYAFAIWLFVGIPLALGSWWTLAVAVLVLPVLVWRLLDEERVLQRDLRGYAAYMQRVRYRLIPGIW